MHRIALLFILISFLPASALAQTTTPNESLRKDWHLCQAGDIERCNRLLRQPLDPETRSLVQADLEQAHERMIAQVRALVHLCTRRVYVAACDRALRYSLTQAERSEILELRKAAVIRASRSVHK